MQIALQRYNVEDGFQLTSSDRSSFMIGQDAHSISLPYGRGMARALMPSGRCLATLDVLSVEAVEDPADAIREALDQPIGQDRCIFEIVQPDESVLILVSDSFRQTRADLVLPVLLNGLIAAGVKESDVSILFSTGTHRGPTEAEQRGILGEDVYRRMQGRMYIHDANDTESHVHLGTTSRGTPVEINRRLQEADRVIVTGGVVLHYFGGFGGGRKSVVPGVASARTIAHNHAMNLHPTEDRLDPKVRIGVLAGNPVAEDMLEASNMARVDCIVNTVLTREGDIAGVVAGDLEAAHGSACEFARELYEVAIHEKADLVLAASPGTKNFVQTHKSLFNAYQAVKPGGRIILLAPCSEGLGGDQFTKWLELGGRAEIIAGLRRQSEINGQTALSTREKAPRCIMVTELSEEDVALLGAIKEPSLQRAIDTALAGLRAENPEPTYYLMPAAAYSVPILGGREGSGLTP